MGSFLCASKRRSVLLVCISDCVLLEAKRTGDSTQSSVALLAYRGDTEDILHARLDLPVRLELTPLSCMFDDLLHLTCNSLFPGTDIHSLHTYTFARSQKKETVPMQHALLQELSTSIIFQPTFIMFASTHKQKQTLLPCKVE